VGEAAFELPWNLPLGWHRLVAHVDAEAMDPSTTTATVVVTPHRLTLPEGLDERRGVGVATQLYQVRSEGSWGIGDLGDAAGSVPGRARTTPRTSSSSTRCTPRSRSPRWSRRPTCRRRAGSSTPSTCGSRTSRRRASSTQEDAARLAALAAHGRALNTVDGIDRDGSWELKRAALGLVHAVGRSGSRADAYRAFLDEEGEGLVAYATWCALAEAHGLPAASWPADVQDPLGEGVARWREEHADEVDLHCWMQWLLAEQVRDVQSVLRASGMRVGLLEDLAVGVHTQGSDAWSLSDVLAGGSLGGGAPDQFNQLGSVGTSRRGARIASRSKDIGRSGTWCGPRCATRAVCGSTT
jgi:4-alpha-glucanotransferase